MAHCIRRSQLPLIGFFFLFIGIIGAFRPALAQRAIPSLTGYVVDDAAILSSDTEAQVSAILEQHEQQTSNQVAVLTIGSLDGEILESYSLNVARTWALGQADKNNGVLLLIAYVDRKMRIEVGYGLEGDLPDILAKRIIDNDIRPYFRNGQFDAGVLSGVQAIVGTIEGTYTPSEASDFEEAPFFVQLIFGLMFLGMPLFALLGTAFQSGCSKWFALFFLMPFLFIGSTVLLPPGGAFKLIVVIVVCYLLFQWYLMKSPKMQHVRDAMDKAEETGRAVPVNIGGMTFTVGGAMSSGSSGGSSFGSGGFSGGGGSFGGGGASGGW